MPVPKDGVWRLVNFIHRNAFKATGGRLGGKLAGMTVIMLITQGRKTREPRTTMLTAVLELGERLVVVASKGGSHKHPTWFLNLSANPDVDVVAHRRRLRMRARIASPEEKKELWPRVTKRFPGYAQYQRSTNRDIPLVILEPKS